MGFPFPKIDPADPNAAVKAVWNFFYRTYYFGPLRAESQLNMMSPSSLERRLDVVVDFMYYDGVPQDERVPNAENFLYQQLVVVTSPSDVNGTLSLSWRFRDPNKRDVSWAPIAAGLARRHFYVLEAVPKDTYYHYGKVELYLETIGFQGAWNRKFRWKGELLNTTQVMAWNPHTVVRPNGKKDWVQGSNQAFQCSENVKINRATIAGIKSSPKAGFDARIKFDPSHFALESLARYGK